MKCASCQRTLRTAFAWRHGQPWGPKCAAVAGLIPPRTRAALAVTVQDTQMELFA